MNNKLQKRIRVLSMIMAPLLIAVCQFFWWNGVLTSTAGWLQVLSFVFWIPAFSGMFDTVKENFPRLAVYGFLISVYACLGGNNFGVEGIYNSALNITDVEAGNNLRLKLGVGGIVAFYAPGVLFPLTIITLAILLWKAKKIEGWLAILLLIAAAGFPASRVPRVDLIAHIDNFLMLASMTFVAFKTKND